MQKAGGRLRIWKFLESAINVTAMTDPYNHYCQLLIMHRENYPIIPAADAKKVTLALKLFHIRRAGINSESGYSLPNPFPVRLGKLGELARRRGIDADFISHS